MALVPSFAVSRKIHFAGQAEVGVDMAALDVIDDAHYSVLTPSEVNLGRVPALQSVRKQVSSSCPRARLCAKIHTSCSCNRLTLKHGKNGVLSRINPMNIMLA